MEITSTFEDVTPTRRCFTITVPSTQLKSAVDGELHRAKESAALPGYRKGKAPASLVMAHLGQKIINSALNSVINSAVEKVRSTSNAPTFGQPAIDLSPVESIDTDLQFTATFDINPLIEIKGYKELSLEVEDTQQEPKEQQLENFLKRLSLRHASFRKRGSEELATKEDLVKIKSEFILNEKKQNSTESFRIVDIEQKMPQLAQAIVGANTGTTKTIALTFGEDIANPDLKGKTVDFTFTLLKIKEVVPAAVDDALAQKLGFNDLAAVKETFENGFNKQVEDNKIDALQPQIIDKLLEKNDFAVSEFLVETTIDNMIGAQAREMRQELDAKDPAIRESFREKATKEVKGVLALGHVARMENISVSNEEALLAYADFCMQNNIPLPQSIRSLSPVITEEFRGQILLHKVIKHIAQLNGITF